MYLSDPLRCTSLYPNKFIYFTFKVQEDGGTAIHSENCDLWLANGFGTSTSEHSYRFIAADVGSKYYLYVTSTQASIYHV